MTTPAKNENLVSNVTCHYVVRNKNTGAVTAQGDRTWERSYRRDVRPQSTKNPKRPDGTRRNGGWNHNWCRTHEFGSTLTANSGTNGIITTTGALLVNGASGAVTSDLTSGLMRNARLAALSKATEGAAQASAAVLQARDLIGMTGEYTRSAARGLDNLWNKHGGKMKRALAGGWKKIPDEYLKYLYGIAPLADDVENCLDRLARYSEKGYKMSMILRAEKRTRTSYNVANFVRHGTGNLNVRFPCRASIACRVGYRFDLPSWYVDKAPTVAPFSTAWQLAPYSFVLDWILPVGDYIGALESAQYSPFFSEGFEVWMVRESGMLSQAEITNSGYAPRLSLKGRWERGNTVRTAVSVYPSSILTRPALNPFPGTGKVSQGLSLLAQALNRSR